MKIIYIVNARIPTEKAHGYQIAKMCEAFALAGVEVELWLPLRKNTIRENIFDAYGLKHIFTVQYIKIPDFLRHRQILQGPIYLVQTFLFLILLFFKKTPGAVIYTRNPEIAFLWTLKRSYVVFEDHGWPKNKKRLYRFLLRKVGGVVAITHCIARIYKNMKEAPPVFVAPDAVDLDLFTISHEMTAVRDKLGLPQDKKIIMYTGSFYLYAWKGVDVLLDAAEYLPEQYLVVLVGADESEYNEFNLRYRSPNIRIIARKEHMEIPYYLKASDVLVLPNKKGNITSECYTSPLKLFEYMASGVPIVASRIASVQEILSDDNSCLVEANDAQKLALGIKKVVASEEYSKKIAVQARIDVMDHTWLKRAERVINFIQSQKCTE